MPIFNAKKQARKNAKLLAEQYDIKYSPDGETFSIYAKGDIDGVKGRTDLMAEADKWLPGRTRKLTNRLYQREVENRRLSDVKSSQEKAKADAIAKALADAEVKKKKGKEDVTKKGNDVDLNTALDWSKAKYEIDNSDLTLDVVKPVDMLPPGVKRKKSEKSSPYALSEDLGMIGDIPSSDIHDITSISPFAFIEDIQLNDFIKAKELNKTYIVRDNKVYDVKENLSKYDFDRTKWSPEESKNYRRTFDIGNDLGNNTPVTLTKGVKPFWETINLLEHVSGRKTNVVKLYKNTLRFLGPKLTNLLKSAKTTNPKEVTRILEVGQKALEAHPKEFVKVVKLAQKQLPMGGKSALSFLEKSLSKLVGKEAKYLKEVVKKPDFMKAFYKKSGGKLIAKHN